MRLHGGTLSIESTLGKGTVVTAHFPSERLAGRDEKFTEGDGGMPVEEMPAILKKNAVSRAG